MEKKLRPEAEERLNVLMRPERGVHRVVIAQGLLAVLGEERNPEAALAYVFATWPWAYWSGPVTPAKEFPRSFDIEPGGRDRADAEAFVRDEVFLWRFREFVAGIRADQADANERARRAWAFIDCMPSRFGRAFALAAMLASDTFVANSTTPPVGTPRFNAEIQYHAILWRNRGAIAKLNGIVSSTAFETKMAVGDAVLAALAEIPDELDRAAVLGTILDQKRSGRISVEVVREVGVMTADGMIGSLRDLRQAVQEAAERGERCPFCGRVHGQDTDDHDSD